MTKNDVIVTRTYRGRAPLQLVYILILRAFFLVSPSPPSNHSPRFKHKSDSTNLSTTMQTRAMKRKALAGGAPAINPTVTDTSPNATSAIESEPEGCHLPSWNSVCIESECPIEHPHNFGLRPQTFSAPERVPLRHGAHAAISTDHGYPDIQPPPLIKAIIDALRMDRDITIRYESFPAVLRDFYRAHGGRSDKYHGSAGMFGFGVYVTPSVHGDRVCVPHKHPECDYTVD